MQKQNEKATITAVKKNAALVSNAVKMAIANDGVFKGTTVKAWYDYISPYLKIQKYCGTATGCWVNSRLKSLHGADWINMDSAYTYQKAILADGSSFQTWTSPDSDNAEFRIDYNGKKGPNTVGIDIFYFSINKKDGKIRLVSDNGANYSDYEGIYLCKKNDTSSSYNGLRCTDWIFFNDNMDYLHCDDLSWNGKTKCN